MRLIAPASAVLLVWGCSCEAPRISEDAAIGSDTIADSHVVVPPVHDVDILVVVDDSATGADAEERVAMAFLLERLAGHLAFSWDSDGDGTPDFPAASSVHVGIASGDMGIGAITDGGEACDRRLGDDAALAGLAGGPPSSPRCVLPADGVARWTTGDDVNAFGLNLVWCVELELRGCVHQQMLEAALKAVSPTQGPSGGSSVSWTSPGYAPPTFFDDTPGRAGPGGTNAALVRPDSVLVVLMVSPQDDCSTASYEIFSESDTTLGDIRTRCHLAEDRRYPVSRYIDGFLGLRTAPSRLVLGVMAGMPDPGESTPEQVLTDPRLDERYDSFDPGRLLPACNDENGPGYPARRFLAVAAGVAEGGGHAVIGTSCGTDPESLTFEARLMDAIGAAMLGG